MRILIVEDDLMIADGLKDDLELEGFTVDVTADGESAETMARQNAYDLILLDLMLPRRDGLVVCRNLRAAGVESAIIVLTAKSQEADKVVGLAVGADDYVTKPYSRLELMARVKAVLRRTSDGKPSDPDVWESGGLRVDFQRCHATISGQPIRLTATEFKILKALFESRGKVVTIDQLLQRVWGADVFLTDRVIYTHVNNLRAKIEPDPSTPRFIVGVRGLGYRFDG
jgi:DNA-binding response OmpR family regulator